MHNNSLCTAANAEAVLSFLRDRGILEDDGATPQQVEEKSESKRITTRFYCSQIIETFFGRPKASWNPWPPSSISLCESLTLY